MPPQSNDPQVHTYYTFQVNESTGRRRYIAALSLIGCACYQIDISIYAGYANHVSWIYIGSEMMLQYCKKKIPRKLNEYDLRCEYDAFRKYNITHEGFKT